VTTTMRAAVWHGGAGLTAQDLPVPDLPDGWALVEVAYAGLCGTDLAILAGQHPRAAAPLIPGHELSGRVTASADPRLRAGDLVVAEPLISCGTCWACTHGSPHVCSRLGLYGIDAPGGMAQYVALPADRLHVVPDGVDARLAALAEPLAVAVHSVANSGLRAGDTVAVYGAGPVGMLTAMMARHEGAREVVVTDPNAWRLDVARALGFSAPAAGETLVEAVRARTTGEGADVTFDTAGHPSVAAEATEATRVLGTVVVVGVHKHPAEVDLRRLNFAEQRMQGVRVYTAADVERAVGLLAGDVLGLGRLPVRVFSLEDADEAVEAARTGERNLKVLVSPSGTGVTG
jgi:(R,R)-butanediol dehydrogenase/meso-butanediol dehydrogenase/diacetyl reductase